jgi:predicted ArsR family transcriptional regulator
VTDVIAEVGGGPDVQAALSSPVRRKLLHTLRAAASACDAHQLADEVGLHFTTVRFHLQVLLRAGLVERHSAPSPGAGRPRMTYAATLQVEDAQDLGYRELARRLAARLADDSEERARRAEEVGLAWAEDLVSASTSTGHTLDEATQQVTALFHAMGFEPESAADGAVREISIHACPFRSLAREHPEVMCSVHLGLLRGTLGRLGADVNSELHPFVESELCLAELTDSS